MLLLNRIFQHAARVMFPQSMAIPILLAGILSSPAGAQQPGQNTYPSPEAASRALVEAAQKNDEKGLIEILGPEGHPIVSSGDEAEDANDRVNFVEKYQEMHRLVQEPDGTTTLYIGAKNWPTPIPLLNKGNLWYFDTLAGKQEILCRRIGLNETSALRVCLDLVQAQTEFFALQHGAYAEVVISDEGKRNGLYWKAPAGEAPSPISPLVAPALAKGYAINQGGVLTPYCGYAFGVLHRQGKHAPGGAKNYSVKGRMTDGFALVAYPAEYRSSGVMTFIVDRHGVVFQKDLGRRTVALARAMKAYDPGPGWQKADARLVQAASEEGPK